MNLVIRKIGRCPPFSHMGDLLNTCMLWIGLFECHILLENPVEFRYEPEFWLSFRFRSTESGIFKNTTPVPAQPEPDFQYIRYPAGYSGSVSGLLTSLTFNLQPLENKHPQTVQDSKHGSLLFDKEKERKLVKKNLSAPLDANELIRQHPSKHHVL